MPVVSNASKRLATLRSRDREKKPKQRPTWTPTPAPTTPSPSTAPRKGPTSPIHSPKMPELTEVLNTPAAESDKNNEAAGADSGTESDSDDSVPELEDTGAGGTAQTQVH